MENIFRFQFVSGRAAKLPLLGVLALAGALAAQPAQSQTDAPAGNPAPQAQTGVQPTTAIRPRVVRLSDVEGMVQIERGGAAEFSHAVMNMPLIEGSQLSTGADGRAEIEFEDGSVARITPNSSVTLRRMATAPDGQLQTEVEQLSGLVYYELRSDPRTTFTVAFGGRTAVPTVNSTFRVDLSAVPAQLAVLEGKVAASGASGSYQAEVAQGKTIEFQPSANARYTIAGILPNGFDDWNDQRDQEAAAEAKNQTPARVQQGGGSVMDGGIGWSDLDSYGEWYPLPGYGMVWQPAGIDAGFDPYGDGMWANYGGGFGYTWVSGYPWGWLPFHYGMWSYIGGFGWGWLPCAYPFGGFGYGYGYGGYGYGHRDGDGDGRRYPATNVYGGPAGYHAPVPPTIAHGQAPPRIVPVGRGAGLLSRPVALANRRAMPAGHAPTAARPVTFNGQKIAPLRSTMSGIEIPVRNAALINNYPAHAYPGGIRTALMTRSPAGGTSAAAIRPGFAGHAAAAPAISRTQPATFGRGGEVRMVNNVPLSAHSFGAGNRAGFARQTSFGSHGSFGAPSSPFRGGVMSAGPRGFSGGGGFRGGGMSRAGGFSGGGMRGGGMSGGGGFHGGSVGSGGTGHTGR